jgi:integrase
MNIRTDIAVTADPEHGWRDASSTLLAILADHGFAGPPLSLLHFGVEFTRSAISERNRLMEQRLSGASSDVTILNPALAAASPLLAPPPRPAQAKEPLTTETLLAAWAAEAKPSRATQKKYGGAFNRVAGVVGDNDVRRWAAEDVFRFKQARLNDGRDPKTISDDVLACSAVCKWATANRLLDVNPFSGLAPKVSRRGEARRAPYTDDEAQRILSAARDEEGWLRWMPWLLAFTSTRISELADLRRGDVREDGGVMILDLHPTSTREGKNSTMQRMLPLHPAVIAEGFLEYVADLPVDPMAPLFPSIRPDPRGGRAQPATTQMGRWIRGVVGITDPKKGPSHSWRHRMEDELRKVRAHPEMMDAITGRHNPRNAGAGYGKGFRGMPDELLKELVKIPSPCSPAQRPTERQIGDGLAAAPH